MAPCVPFIIAENESSRCSYERKQNPSIWREKTMNGSNSRESTKQKMNWYTLSMIAALLICPLKGAAQDHPLTPPTPVQIVVLDECDPTTFNADPKAKENQSEASDSRLMVRGVVEAF